ncbi:transcriptional regulator, TetR family [Tistlia consotensis]|uniref:Transcriptional regulator, TetR family n=1 Tax=Tistlia consotensis USBA 355 TaxID=560819 RepID=A0A1Y6BCF4_9PROT|nr:TetR family transcriptional regulator [Tistlia consotensis]SMF02286.1 transcriptional regulator, TetR family [Tistlia consotensis USBA 355]SNS26645.1 transcriptional regulator, TetR family [Tistlia consotensis]
MTRPTAGKAGEAPRPGTTEAKRTNNPEKTRENILAVARHEFATKGLSGARIDEIADRTATSKRMIYYYFGSKEGLYLAVLEEAYARIRAHESTLELEALPPLEALARLVRFTFDYQSSNEEFVRLVMVENIHNGAFIARSKAIRQTNLTVIDALRDICARGRANGTIRADVEPIDLHMTISALCFFAVANRHTFSTIFDLDMTSRAALEARRESVVATILRSVAA